MAVLPHSLDHWFDICSHSAPVLEALCTPKPGTRTMSRTSKSSNTAERAQSSSKSRQIYGANPDPWAIQDQFLTRQS
ncbi:NADPH-dependent FMN reductase ArsH [Fusarium oxysporum f. sp. albedinis]|nr:NADPH-dependent FMN reductase ArsH [Fusarium oxysporum f. sp. albedinis]